MDKFWGSSQNKLNLKALLHTMLRKCAEKDACQIVISEIKISQLCVSVINGQPVEMPELHSSADEKIILHVYNCTRYDIDNIGTFM